MAVSAGRPDFIETPKPYSAFPARFRTASFFIPGTRRRSNLALSLIYSATAGRRRQCSNGSLHVGRQQRSSVEVAGEVRVGRADEYMLGHMRGVAVAGSIGGIGLATGDIRIANVPVVGSSPITRSLSS